MPLALDPSETVEVVLAIDAEKPQADQPKFIVHFLSCRETLRFNRFVNEAFVLPPEKGDEENELLNKALAVALVGWRNVRGRDGEAIAFSIDALDDVLTPREKWRLARQIPEAIFLAEKEKKAYASSPRGGGEASAPTAAAASVQTPQAS